MNPALPEFLEVALTLAHPSWQTPLRAGIHAMLEEQPHYFSALASEHPYNLSCIGNQVMQNFLSSFIYSRSFKE